MRAARVVFGIAVEHRHGALDDDRAGVELRGHEMHGDAAHLHAVRERLLLGVKPGKRRQERRMDVDDGVWETPR